MKNVILIIAFAMTFTSCTYHYYPGSDPRNYPQGQPGVIIGQTPQGGPQVGVQYPQGEYTPAIDGYNPDGYGFLDSEPYSNIEWNCWQEERWITNPITGVQQKQFIEKCNPPTGARAIFHIRVPTPQGIIRTVGELDTRARFDGDTPLIEALYDKHTKQFKYPLPLRVGISYFQGKYLVTLVKP